VAGREVFGSVEDAMDGDGSEELLVGEGVAFE